MENANLETRLGEAMDHIDKHRVQEAQAAFRDILVTFNGKSRLVLYLQAGSKSCDIFV